jgi:uncharacterized protein YdhG (YjbR/CyaY superfamily)
MQMPGMDAAVQSYIDGIAPEHRPLFDRVRKLILAAHPDAAVFISYKIPTYKVGSRRLYVGAWKHGWSIYRAGRGVARCDRARQPRDQRIHCRSGG